MTTTDLLVALVALSPLAPGALILVLSLVSTALLMLASGINRPSRQLPPLGRPMVPPPGGTGARRMSRTPSRPRPPIGSGSAARPRHLELRELEQEASRAGATFEQLVLLDVAFARTGGLCRHVGTIRNEAGQLECIACGETDPDLVRKPRPLGPVWQ